MAISQPHCFVNSMSNVLVAIKSCHKHHARRAAQLATWIPQLDCDFFHLIGNPTPHNGGPVLVDVLSCDVSDAFADIAPKILCACHYSLEHNVEHMFVCDDDTYVVASRLLISDFRKHDYVGWVRPEGDVVNGNVPYMQGSAYWISARAMEQIVLSNEMRPGIIDDGAVGRALYGKVPFVHDARYWPGPVCETWLPPTRNCFISTHKCLPAAMEAVHVAVMRNTTL